MPIILWKNSNCATTHTKTILVITTKNISLRWRSNSRYHRIHTMITCHATCTYSRIVKNTPHLKGSSCKEIVPMASTKYVHTRTTRGCHNATHHGRASRTPKHTTPPNTRAVCVCFCRYSTPIHIATANKKTTPLDLWVNNNAGTTRHNTCHCFSSTNHVAKQKINKPSTCFQYARQNSSYCTNEVTTKKAASTHANTPHLRPNRYIPPTDTLLMSTRPRVNI